jgi:endonuclease YncB( thermonuclease family)
MRTLISLLLIAYIAVASAATLPGQVIRITDGDTIVILAEGNIQHKIRLQGIDAPERGQAYGTKSKQHLSDLVAGHFVTVEYEKRDRYGRIVGKVLVDDKDACLDQVAAGYAWHYKKYESEQTPEDRKRYSEAEIEAREAGRGLWNDPSPIPPWEWRHGERSTSAYEAIRTTRDSASFTCGAKRFCRQMVSCEEAAFHLKICGLTRLDGDSDVAPCELLCRR